MIVEGSRNLTSEYTILTIGLRHSAPPGVTIWIATFRQGEDPFTIDGIVEGEREAYLSILRQSHLLSLSTQQITFRLEEARLQLRHYGWINDSEILEADLKRLIQVAEQLDELLVALQ